MKDRYVSRYIYIYMYGGCCLRLCVSYAGLEHRQASCGYGEFDRSHTEIRRLKKSRRMLQYSIVDLDNHIISCTQTRFNFQPDTTINKMNHDCVLITKTEVHKNFADIKDDLTPSQHKRGHTKIQSTLFHSDGRKIKSTIEKDGNKISLSR